MKNRRIAWTAALLALAVPAAVRADDICVDATKIYFGSRDGGKPAIVRAADCFAAIPEWQELQRRNLGQDDADYWILVSAANSRFRKAVEDVARASGYDLVAEQGSLQAKDGEAPPADITKSVVDKIKASSGDGK